MKDKTAIYQGLGDDNPEISHCTLEEAKELERITNSLSEANKVYKEQPYEFHKVSIDVDTDVGILVQRYKYDPILLYDEEQEKIIALVDKFKLTSKGFNVTFQGDKEEHDVFLFGIINYSFLIYNF